MNVKKRHNPPREYPPGTLKKCKCCEQWKAATLENFSKHRDSADGIAYICLACNRKRTADSYRKKHPVRPRVIRRPKRVIGPPETELEHYIDAFLEARRTLSPATLNTYRNLFSRYANRYPDWPLTPESITGFITAGQADSTRRVYYQSLKAFCIWLEKTGQLDPNPIRQVIPPRVPDLLPRVPKSDRIIAFFAHLESTVEKVLSGDDNFRFLDWVAIRNLAVYSLMFDTGLRVGEVVALNLSDIDLQEGTIFVRNAKGQKQRYVMMAKKARGNLKLWLTYRAKLTDADLGPAVFVTKRSGWSRLGTYNVEAALARYCEALELPRFTPHQLRHGYAVYSLQNGANIEDIRQQMGHSNLLITGRYLRMPNEGKSKRHLMSSPLDHLGA